jgi:hypothetical protein
MVYLLRKLGGPRIGLAPASWTVQKKRPRPPEARAGDNQSSNLSAPLGLVKGKTGPDANRENEPMRCKCIRIRHLRRHLAKPFSVAKATKPAMLERVPPPNI